MTEQEAKLVVGSLLHDIEEIIGHGICEGSNAGASGYNYLKEEVGIEDQNILHCVKSHYVTELEAGRIEQNDLSYIVYQADSIAAAADHKEKVQDQSKPQQRMPLQSIFNILNENDQQFYYRPEDLEYHGEINFPQSEKIPFSKEENCKIKQRITENLKEMKWTNAYINSLLAVLEANLTYIPAKEEFADVSLFDHVKLTAAIASCIYEYFQEKGISDYETHLYKGSSEFYQQDTFLMCSMDISGIQNFIYTTSSKNALRTLRARSFYLEILMEHMIDCLLERLHLSRANLLYSGGGHCYLLLPNTQQVEKCVEDYIKEINRWFIRYFKNSLYIAAAYVPCSSRNLQNIPEGSYANLFRDMGKKISKKKSNRYTADEIRELNLASANDYTRECKVCKEIGKTDEEGVCTLCRKFEHLSQDVLYSKFFTILHGDKEEGMPLPGDYVLVAEDGESVRKRMNADVGLVRTYVKNDKAIGEPAATKLWVGDYTTGQTFEEFSKDKEGIKRIGILRADVDNLGQTFVSGLENKKYGNKYVTLSRSAALSRHLSIFFKFYIRDILKEGSYSIDGKICEKPRKATIIYSGGDDVFIVGAWQDVIELSIDLKHAFEKYTQGTLSLSAGIGIYEAGYPIRAIAAETGELEEKSKSLPGKNAVTIFEDGKYHKEYDTTENVSDGTYHWKQFEEAVIGEKYRSLQEFLENTEDRGMAFLYHLLELIRNRGEKINFARCVYLLARLEPSDKIKKQRYQVFSKKMYQWIQSEKDCRELKTAINLYAYKNREKGGHPYADD